MSVAASPGTDLASSGAARIVELSHPYRVRRVASNTARRTSIRFGSYIWNMQGESLP
jgi:hypothetical protein